MAQLNYISAPYITSNSAGLNDGGTLTLIGAGTNNVQLIYGIAVRALGAITVVRILVTKNDGSTVIWDSGATSTLPVGGLSLTFDSPIVCAKGDNAKITVTVTGGTAGSLSICANYQLGTS